MAGLAVGLIQKAKQCGDSAAHNAALESFLVHYRALRDFLHADKYPKRQIRNDDIIAEDFSPNDWGLKRPPWQECLSNEKEKIDRQLEHLSYSRSRYRQWNWRVGDMWNVAFANVRAFLGGIPSRRRRWFVSDARNPYCERVRQMLDF